MRPLRRTALHVDSASDHSDDSIRHRELADDVHRRRSPGRRPCTARSVRLRGERHVNLAVGLRADRPDAPSPRHPRVQPLLAESPPRRSACRCPRRAAAPPACFVMSRDLRIAQLHELNPGTRDGRAGRCRTPRFTSARMCATVFGASFGYVSNSNVPFIVSTTMTGRRRLRWRPRGETAAQRRAPTNAPSSARPRRMRVIFVAVGSHL